VSSQNRERLWSQWLNAEQNVVKDKILLNHMQFLNPHPCSLCELRQGQRVSTNVLAEWQSGLQTKSSSGSIK
jgi:hypothetical protein